MAWMCSGSLRKDSDVDVPAVVVTYDPGWPGLFRELRDRVDSALAGVAYVTEHVGSTAVPGLDAKPVIDLDVVVPGDAAVGPAIGALAGARWRHQGDLGIKGREAFAPPADAVYHHLCVVVAGGQPHRDHVDLKHRLAGLLATDRLAYSDGKAEMIAEFLRQARCRTSSARGRHPVRRESSRTSSRRRGRR
jgi:GrpB-like predicted nucleotidyltransferase (UPF0157 family)